MNKTSAIDGIMQQFNELEPGDCLTHQIRNVIECVAVNGENRIDLEKYCMDRNEQFELTIEQIGRFAVIAYFLNINKKEFESVDEIHKFCHTLAVQQRWK